MSTDVSTWLDRLGVMYQSFGHLDILISSSIPTLDYFLREHLKNLLYEISLDSDEDLCSHI